MKLLLNKAHYPVTALGPGTRAGIWTQGCTIGCAGCLSRDTWVADPNTAIEVGALLGWVKSLPQPIDGITVSGGEPFQQPDALAELLTGLRYWRGDREIDVLVYSGYPAHRLKREFPELLRLCDAVIAGPYVQRRNTGLRWRGSANQKVLPLSPLGEARYGEIDDNAAPQLQVSVDGDQIYYIGIPRPDDLERVTQTLESVQITTGAASWRS